MAKVISFISRKGGTGKTTNAINLATSLHEAGKRVLLVETDANYTLSTLRKMELFKAPEKSHPFEIVGSADDRIADELVVIKKDKHLDIVIVDSGIQADHPEFEVSRRTAESCHTPFCFAGRKTAIDHHQGGTGSNQRGVAPAAAAQ